MNDVTIFIAFVAGILSFLSPCILPIIPGFMAYLSGTSGQNLGASEQDSTSGKNLMSGHAAKLSRIHSFLNSLAFVVGFSTIFALLGVLLNTALASSAYIVRLWLSRIAGVVIILFGLHVTGLLVIPFLMMEHRVDTKKFSGNFRNTYLTSFVFGASFDVGWSQCVGAILGSVLALALSNPGISFALLMAYALGLGIPFLIVGWFTEGAMALVKKSGKFLRYFNIVVGALLVILGILIFTSNLNLIASFIVPQGLIQ